MNHERQTGNNPGWLWFIAQEIFLHFTLPFFSSLSLFLSLSPLLSLSLSIYIYIYVISDELLEF